MILKISNIPASRNKEGIEKYVRLDIAFNRKQLYCNYCAFEEVEPVEARKNSNRHFEIVRKKSSTLE